MAPPYLRGSLNAPLHKLNEYLETVQECVNDKFFGEDGVDYVTQEELAVKLGLGSRTKTFLLLLQHCGRLQADLAAKQAGGSVRYRICT